MTVFILKLIAMCSMVIDHTAFWLVNNNNAMRNIGRFAFITYAFLIAESYYHLKDKPDRLRSHVMKLFILCLISEPLRDQYIRLTWFDWTVQNTIPTLFLGFLTLIGIDWWEKQNFKDKSINTLGAVAICLLAAFLSFIIRSGYEFGGVILIVLFYQYLCKANDLGLWQKLVTLLLIDIVYICSYIWASSGFGCTAEIAETARSFNRRLIGNLLAVVPLALYNRKRGYNSKLFRVIYSCFYPFQYVVLIVLRHFIRGF